MSDLARRSPRGPAGRRAAPHGGRRVWSPGSHAWDTGRRHATRRFVSTPAGPCAHGPLRPGPPGRRDAPGACSARCPRRCQRAPAYPGGRRPGAPAARRRLAPRPARRAARRHCRWASTRSHEVTAPAARLPRAAPPGRPLARGEGAARTGLEAARAQEERPASEESRRQWVAQIRADLPGPRRPRRPGPCARSARARMCGEEGEFFVTRGVRLCSSCVGLLQSGAVRRDRAARVRDRGPRRMSGVPRALDFLASTGRGRGVRAGPVPGGLGRSLVDRPPQARPQRRAGPSTPRPHRRPQHPGEVGRVQRRVGAVVPLESPLPQGRNRGGNEQ